MFNIEEELKKLPAQAGVYIMRDKKDSVIYVGKAIILKNRVKQYFRKNNKTARIEKMVSLIDHFEYIVTANEAEALILECNLIKKYKPKFNVLLKDDKTYPYIKIDIQSDYPNVFITRRLQNDGAKYFGPYPNSGAAKQMISFIKDKFQIRQCKTFKSNKRACLNYHIKKCLAPCVNSVSKEEYLEQIEQIIMLLEGKTSSIIKSLEEKIKVHSEKQEYEIAAILRDKKNAIEKISEKQKVANLNENAIDVIGIAESNSLICAEVFFVRKSKMIGREHYFFNYDSILNKEEFLSSFIKQYYMNKIDFPNKIMIEKDIEDKETIEEWLSEKAQRKIIIKIPRKGEKLQFVEMAKKNAKITLDNKTEKEENMLLKLKRQLDLATLPNKIEAYDISNISGDYLVAGMCVAQNGKINKRLSRKFKIKTVYQQNDPACLHEVVSRRLKHSITENSEAFGSLPDLILADGGIFQIRAIEAAIDENNLKVPVYGMVKNSKHKTNKLINNKGQEIDIDEEIMNFITNLQNEVHNVAINYNRAKRNENTTKSELDIISGIGERKKQELYIKFGSIEEIKRASIEEIAQVKGINEELAKKIKEKLM